MNSPITVSWDRIEAWLAQNAPRTSAALGPPAERSAIAEAEQVIGQPFPEALVESLLRHDGMGHHSLLPPFWSLLGTQGIVSAWQRRTRIDAAGPAGAEEDDPEAEYGPWWNAQWIPFALDGAGDYLIVDPRSHRLSGRIGVADHETGCSFRRHPRWASLPALLEATATALESGRALDGCSPVVLPEGELGWNL